MKGPVTITLPWPAKELQSNARCHWSVKSRATKAARSAAFWLGKEAKVGAWPDAVLRFTYHPPDRRRRDCQDVPNSLKASIDGIADAMGVDDYGFKVHYPPEFSEVRKGGAIVVEILPSSEWEK